MKKGGSDIPDGLPRRRNFAFALLAISAATMLASAGCVTVTPEARVRVVLQDQAAGKTIPRAVVLRRDSDRRISNTWIAFASSTRYEQEKATACAVRFNSGDKLLAPAYTQLAHLPTLNPYRQRGNDPSFHYYVLCEGYVPADFYSGHLRNDRREDGTFVCLLRPEKPGTWRSDLDVLSGCRTIVDQYVPLLNASDPVMREALQLLAVQLSNILSASPTGNVGKAGPYAGDLKADARKELDRLSAILKEPPPEDASLFEPDGE